MDAIKEVGGQMFICADHGNAEQLLSLIHIFGVDVVLECTGFYTSKDKAQAHIDACLLYTSRCV